MTMVPTERRSAVDRGSVLPMALILVVVFGAVAAALAGFGAVSLRLSVTIRDQNSLRASAEAGLRYQLDRLLLDPACMDSAALPITPNNATIEISCGYVSGSNPSASRWAMVLTGNGASSTAPVLVSSGSNTTKNIQGTVYLGVTSPPSTVSNLAKPLSITNGDLWYYKSSCTSPTAPTISNLTITPAPPRGKLCTAQTWQTIAPSPTMPTVPTYTSGNETGNETLVSQCRIFMPGEYRSPPDLAGDVYFVSGDYYFNFNGTINVKNADVQGGQPNPNGSDVAYLPELSDPSNKCANVLSNTDVVAAESGYGVSWIFGSGAKLNVDNNGRLELYSREQGDTYVSLWAAESTASGYTASTITMSNGPFVGMKSGGNNDMVIHGVVRAPNAQVQFGNVSNAANAQMIGGIVAAGIDMQSSASAANFIVGNTTQPATTKTVITSKATSSADPSKSVTMQAVVDFRTSRSVTDATTTLNSTTLTSATAAFTSADVGRYIVGSGVADGTTIASVTNSTTVVLSAVATSTGTGRTIIIKTPQVAINSWRKL